jgi:hypothetical protein
MPELDILTEVFRIPQRDIRRPLPLSCVISRVFWHYIRGEDERVRTRLARACQRPRLYEFLGSLIKKLNSQVDKNGVPQGVDSITIPTSIYFFRRAFPTFNIAEGRQFQARIDPNIGILKRLGFVEEIENIVRFPGVSIPFNSLYEESRVQIRRALHEFKIYTFPSILNPPERVTLAEERRDVSAAVQVFQREYMGAREEDDLHGNFDRDTLLMMNDGLAERWRRSVPYERVQTDNTRRYYVRLGVRPIIPRFNQQSSAWFGFPDWGDTAGVTIPRVGRNGLPVYSDGCAVAFVANMAFTHRQRLIAVGALPEPAPHINRITLAEDTDLITPRTITGIPGAFNANGGIFWHLPLRPLSPLFPVAHHHRRRNVWHIVDGREVQQDHGFQFPPMDFDADWLDRFMNNAENNEFYIAIRIFVDGDPQTVNSQHWVGVNELVMRNGASFYRISPTSINDRISNAANRAGRGWQFWPNGNNPTDIYIPVSEVVEYRVFQIPQNE